MKTVSEYAQQLGANDPLFIKMVNSLLKQKHDTQVRKLEKAVEGDASWGTMLGCSMVMPLTAAAAFSATLLVPSLDGSTLLESLLGGSFYGSILLSPLLFALAIAARKDYPITLAKARAFRDNPVFTQADVEQAITQLQLDMRAKIAPARQLVEEMALVEQPDATEKVQQRLQTLTRIHNNCAIMLQAIDRQRRAKEAAQKAADFLRSTRLPADVGADFIVDSKREEEAEEATYLLDTVVAEENIEEWLVTP
jgi:hypothetical protein